MISLDAIWMPETQQRIFRKVLRAMSYPGRLVDFEAELDAAPAMVGMLACLLDATTTFCDLDELLPSQTIELLETQVANPNEAEFVLGDATREPPETFRPKLGDIYQPHRGATVVLVCERLGKGQSVVRCTGPGVNGTEEVCVLGIHQRWFDARERWVSHFPMGVDMLLCDNARVVGLPRTTCLEYQEKKGSTNGVRRDSRW
ncbi:MAG: phosphonate C-P lyase system protein PhnH [Gemmataceae bacterium]